MQIVSCTFTEVEYGRSCGIGGCLGKALSGALVNTTDGNSHRQSSAYTGLLPHLRLVMLSSVSVGKADDMSAGEQNRKHFI